MTSVTAFKHLKSWLKCWWKDHPGALYASTSRPDTCAYRSNVYYLCCDNKTLCIFLEIDVLKKAVSRDAHAVRSHSVDVHLEGDRACWKVLIFKRSPPRKAQITVMRKKSTHFFFCFMVLRVSTWKWSGLYQVLTFKSNFMCTKTQQISPGHVFHKQQWSQNANRILNLAHDSVAYRTTITLSKFFVGLYWFLTWLWRNVVFFFKCCFVSLRFTDICFYTVFLSFHHIISI